MKQNMLLLAALASAAAASAANPKGERLDTLRTYELQDVQVLSTRAGKTVPMAYTDMSKLQIKETNFGKDIPSLLNYLPSVTMTSDAGTGIGYSSIYVRGTDPTRINITANGVPVNDAESSQLYWVNMGDFASSLESMQVQRGVGTSTNGAGAFGATVNMQTENIGLKPYGSFDVSGGTYGTHKETFRFGTGLLGGHWGFQGRLSNIGSDGYIDRASARLNSYFLQGGYFSDNTVVKFITFNGTEKTYHAWDYASKADMQKYGRTYNPSGLYYDKDGNPLYYSNQTDNYHQQHYQLLWNQNWTDNLSMNVTLHYTRGDGYYEQMKTDQKLYKYLLAPEDKGYRADLVRQKKMGNDFYGAIASLNYDSKNGFQATLGGGWNKYDGDHFGKVIWAGSPYVYDDDDNKQFVADNIYTSPDHEYYRNNAKKTDGNVYGKISYEFLPGLSAFVDLQYRHISYKMSGMSAEFNDDGQRPMVLDKKYDFFNPKAGLFYQINSNHSVYASYAIAHKEPVRNNFEDMMAEAEEVEPKAERLNDLEIGYKYQSGIFNAGVNFYYMTYDNQFVLTGAQDTNGEMISRNIKDSYRMGVELMAGLNPFRGFNWNVNATFSKNRAKNMELNVIHDDWSTEKVNVGTTHLAFSPDVIVNNIFSYEYKGLRAALMSKYVGEQYMTNSGFKAYEDLDPETGKSKGSISTMIDSYFTSDLDLSYTFKLRGLKSMTVGVTVYNLFNEEYESNGSASMNFKKDKDGKLIAFGDGYNFWSWSTYSAQAPTHFLAHLSVNF